MGKMWKTTPNVVVTATLCHSPQLSAAYKLQVLPLLMLELTRLCKSYKRQKFCYCNLIITAQVLNSHSDCIDQLREMLELDQSREHNEVILDRCIN